MISKEGLPAALGLVWNVFLEFEAPDYSQEGIDEFERFIDNQTKEMTIEMYGAFENDELMGVIATRNEGRHIALFFVRADHHGRGIGRTLFKHLLALNKSDFLTVNSSPYAAEIYRRLGFTDTAAEQVTNGIRYIPMKCIVGRNDL